MTKESSRTKSEWKKDRSTLDQTTDEGQSCATTFEDWHTYKVRTAIFKAVYNKPYWGVKMQVHRSRSQGFGSVTWSLTITPNENGGLS